MWILHFCHSFSILLSAKVCPPRIFSSLFIHLLSVHKWVIVLADLQIFLGIINFSNLKKISVLFDWYTNVATSQYSAYGWMLNMVCCTACLMQALLCLQRLSKLIVLGLSVRCTLCVVTAGWFRCRRRVVACWKRGNVRWAIRCWRGRHYSCGDTVTAGVTRGQHRSLRPRSVAGISASSSVWLQSILMSTSVCVFICLFVHSQNLNTA